MFIFRQDYFTLSIFILIITAVVLGCGNSKRTSDGSNKVVKDSNFVSLAEDGDSRIEFFVNLSPEEKERRKLVYQSLPRFAAVREALRTNGFNLSSINAAQGAKENASPDLSLSGIGYIGDAKQQISGKEYGVVVMGPSATRVDTIRLQNYGVQSKEARARLLGWANLLLAKLEKGSVPNLVVQKLYSGSNLGDDGESNGFCRIMVLQKPIDSKKSSPFDRISIDLVFDKSLD